MLDFLLPFVDVGFLVVQTAFAAVMVSTIKNQFEARASTVTLVTSLTFGLMASTVLVLIVVPTLYAILNDFGLTTLARDERVELAAAD